MAQVAGVSRRGLNRSKAPQFLTLGVITCCIASGLWFGTSVTKPAPSLPPSLIAGSPLVTIDMPHGADGDAPAVPTAPQLLARFGTVLLTRPPVVTPHRPRRFEAFLKGEDQAPAQEGANSVKVDQEDIERAKASVVRALPTVSVGDASSSGGRDEHLYNLLKDFVVDTVDDAFPYIVDYGSKVGDVFAAQHPNATVVSVSVGVEATAKCKRELAVRNQVRLVTSSVDDPRFAHWLIACNFASAALFLTRAVSDDRYLSRWEPGAALKPLLLILPTSRTVYAALLPSEVQDLENLAGSKGAFDADNPPLEFKGNVERMVVRIRRLAVMWPFGTAPSPIPKVVLDGSGAVILVEVKVLESSRSCAKTWGAPLIQWGRKIFAHIRNNGEYMSFQVRNEKKHDAEGLGRTIHPLQYIPSINLDTLLGAGLSEASRIRLLADMVATPRYSDPLPHNWIVGLGGRAIRIDKVDERFDAKVDETKGYWGNSTRGYMHLLGHHLCLPIAAEGIPLVMSTTCGPSCMTCWNCCSYLPKMRMPCGSCRTCARCIAKQGAEASTDCRLPSCQKTYSSMHQARKLWSTWRNADQSFDRTQRRVEYCSPDLE